MGKDTKDDIKKMLSALDENYCVLADFNIMNSKKQFLGDKDSKVCRFCGKSQSEKVTFKKKAHAISNLVGNNELFSYYECDECNRNFSRFESDYAEYFKIYHTIFKVIGKNGIPSYKRGNSRIDVKTNKISINMCVDSPIVTIDESKKTLAVSCYRSYVPQNVYKAILKMAITLLPQSEIVNVEKQIKFLQGKITIKEGTPLPVYIRIYGGPNANVFKIIKATLFKRKQSHIQNVPGYLFLLAYHNICIQMPIIASKLDDEYVGKELKILFIPDIFIESKIPCLYDKVVDLSSSEKISNEEQKLNFVFERVKEHNLLNKNRRRNRLRKKHHHTRRK